MAGTTTKGSSARDSSASSPHPGYLPGRRVFHHLSPLLPLSYPVPYRHDLLYRRVPPPPLPVGPISLTFVNLLLLLTSGTSTFASSPTSGLTSPAALAVGCPLVSYFSLLCPATSGSTGPSDGTRYLPLLSQFFLFLRLQLSGPAIYPFLQTYSYTTKSQTINYYWLFSTTPPHQLLRLYI